MSIVNNVERIMKRYDYLMDKRERKYKQGKRLSEEEDEELRKLRPNVFTPIMTLFELLHETVKTNQEVRKTTKQRKINQKGGATSPSTSAVAAEAAATAAASAILQKKQKDTTGDPSAPPLDDADADADADNDADDADADEKDAAEARRLSELEESLLPLLTKIIVYIEQNKKAEKNKDGEDEEEEEKYPDIGTTAKNSAILVIRRIKKWWNDLIAGGTSDLSSKINLKKAIPQLANNPDDMNKLNMKAEELNKLAEEATDVIDQPLKKIERLLSNDVRDIASSSVEGIMNALSLIPGIGTTLQLWRLLQNVIVIMSKSVTTMAGAKTQGVELKTGIQNMKGKMEEMATSKVNETANAAVGDAMPQVPGALPGAPAAPALPTPPAAGLPTPPAASALPGAPAAGLPTPPAASALQGAPAAGLSMTGDSMKGGSNMEQRKSNHLRSIKKYRREYKQSLREIKKTRKNILRIIKNII